MVFDKTGTLTIGKPQVVATKIFAEGLSLQWKEFMAIAGTAEMKSEHPLGIALKDYVIEVRDYIICDLLFFFTLNWTVCFSTFLTP